MSENKYKSYLEEKTRSENRFRKFIMNIELIHIIVTIILVFITILQWKQIQIQNKLFEKQNNKIEIQSNLLEAERRGSSYILMENLFNEIDNLEKGDEGINLSNKLLNKIIALSQSFKPYRYYINGSLSELKSPERGILFTFLCHTQFAPNSLNKIVDNTNFDFMEIDNAKFKNLNINDFSASNISLRNVSFEDSHINLRLLDSELFVDFNDCLVPKANFTGSKVDLNFRNCASKLITFNDCEVEYFRVEKNYFPNDSILHQYGVNSFEPGNGYRYMAFENCEILKKVVVHNDHHSLLLLSRSPVQQMQLTETEIQILDASKNAKISNLSSKWSKIIYPCWKTEIDTAKHINSVIDVDSCIHNEKFKIDHEFISIQNKRRYPFDKNTEYYLTLKSESNTRQHIPFKENIKKEEFDSLWNLRLKYAKLESRYSHFEK